MNVRKQIEEKINSGLIAAHHVCTDRINQIQRELEERKRIKYDLYLQETKECREKILGLERESICNSKKAQMLIWGHDYDEVERLMIRNKKIQEIIAVYKDIGRKTIQKYTAAISELQVEAGMQLSYWKDIDMRIQDRIDYNLTYMIDYLY